jgi:hypothetical protein
MKKTSAHICSLIVAVILLSCSELHADPLQYEMALQVNTLSEIPCDNHGSPFVFGCNVHIGDVLTGTFFVDDSILKYTGNNIPFAVSHFGLTVGNVTWDQDHPFPSSAFLSFRAPFIGTNLNKIGFDVSAGKIIGLEGGVFGLFDTPWCDFLGTGFSAVDGSRFGPSGTLQVTPILEPTTGLLTLSGLFLLFIARKMRRV